MRVIAGLVSAYFCVLTCIFAESSTEGSGAALKDLEAWLAKPEADRGAIGEATFSKVALNKEDALAAAKLLWEDRARKVRETRKGEMDEKKIRIGDKEMKFGTLEFGSAKDQPPGGRSLFISMHGGGNAPAALNDQQWENQVRLGKAYKPVEGWYVAPRAPTNTWNLWHEGHIDPLFDRLIEDFVVFENVNPNRVYLLGYSAGGDGVYQLAPRMADRWAAASMMAGHPNETSPVGLRNVPFAIQVGALDNGYNRNKVAAEWGEKLDALKKEDPGGYEHFVELHAGKPHWMGLEDKKAIPWMEKYTRNPYPDKIVWRQDDVLHTQLYWLGVSHEIAKNKQEIRASRRGQEIELDTDTVPTVSVLLNDSVLNMDEPLTIRVKGKEAYRGVVKRTIENLAKTLGERGDRDLMFSGEVPVKTGAEPEGEKK